MHANVEKFRKLFSLWKISLCIFIGFLILINLSMPLFLSFNDLGGYEVRSIK